MALDIVFQERARPNQTYLTFNSEITYEELFNRQLTRHLKLEQVRSIVFFRTSTERVNTFIRTLQDKNGIASVIERFDYRELPILALVAHIKRGDVSQAQVTSICLIYQAIEQLISKRATISCHLDISVFPHVCVNDIFYHPPKPNPPKPRTFSIFEHGSIIKDFFKLTDAGLHILQRRLASPTTPVSESYFHMINIPLGPVLSWSPFYQRITAVAGHYFFEPVNLAQTSDFLLKPQAMVIPSFTMLQLYLNLVYKENAISLMPLLGECSEETITTYKLKDRRVFQVGMPEAPTPYEADSLFSGTYIFSLHDMYHGVRDSMVKSSDRKAIRHIFDRILKRNVNEKTAIIKWKLIDGELYLYQEHFGHLFRHNNGWEWDDDNKMRVLEDMVTLAEFWDEEFGITRSDLLPPEQLLYDSIIPRISILDKQVAMVNLFNYYKSAAKEDPSVQFRLGMMHYRGQGTKVDFGQALSCFKMAASQGHKGAIYNLGVMYGEGKGVEKNPAKYIEYMEMAANLGRKEALYNLAIMYITGEWVEKDLVKGVEYMRKAAELSELTALMKMGFWYYSGAAEFPVPQDYTLAFKYFSEAARLGNIQAIYNLGVMYENGEGVEKDLAKYAACIRKAAEKSHLGALFALGFGHYKGSVELSTPQDYSLAFKYFNQAASLGHFLSIFNLSIMYKEGQGVEKDLVKAYEFAKLALAKEKNSNTIKLYDQLRELQTAL